MSRWMFSVLALVFAVSFFYFLNVRNDQTPQPYTAEQSRRPHNTADATASTRQQSSAAHSTSPRRSDTDAETPSAYAASWPNSDPETHPLLKGNYSRYGIEKLLELIATGDETAMQIMAIKLIVAEPSEKNRQKAGDLMESAVIHGAGEYPFRYLVRDASRELRRAAEGRTTLSREASRSALVETFAYCELAAMRGNAELKQSMINALNQYGIRPSETIQEEVQARAGMMFSQIQAQRERTGLEPFSDSTGGG